MTKRPTFDYHVHLLPTRNDLGRLIPKNAVGAEIGVWRSYYSVEILKWSVRKLYLVDAWKNQGDVYVDPLSNDDHEANFNESKRHTAGSAHRVVYLRGMSLEMAARTDIEPLDFVYIDAAHDYASCLADLRAWARHVKPGGLIMGHDFTDNDQAQKWNFGVCEAVMDFCKEAGWKVTHLTNEDFASYVLERAT